jgi:hypothetical protein
VWDWRGEFIELVKENSFVAGSKISALDKEFSPLVNPPVIKTMPFGSKVEVWAARGTNIFNVFTTLVVTGAVGFGISAAGAV